MRTYFQDFLRDDGAPVTVKYSFRNIGGSGCEVDIVSVMPNTPEFSALCSRSLAAPSSARSTEITTLCDAIDLTAAECDRMIAWLAEHHDGTGGWT